MKSLIYLTRTLALLPCFFYGNAFGQKPHPSCTNSGTIVTTTCDSLPNSINYIFPTTFDVLLIHPEISSLVVEGGLILPNFVPIPTRNKLKTIWLEKFNTNKYADIRFPLNELLFNVKQTIESLTLKGVQLLSLTAADFSGFTNLRYLKIDHGNYFLYLSSISSSVFDELSLTTSEPLSELAQPRLTEMTINNGYQSIGPLDWAFLKPVSRSLEKINMEYCGLADLTTSVPFRLEKLTLLDFGSNDLRSLPEDIFRTLNVSLPLKLHLNNNPMCPRVDDCSCCEVYPFVKWLTHNSILSTLQDIGCRTAQQPLLQVNYEQCDGYEPIPTTQRPTLATRQTPTTNIHPNATVTINSNECLGLELLSSTITIACSKGKLVFSELNFTNTDAWTVELTVDNTRGCQAVMHSAHRLLLNRQTRDAAQPVTVLCRGGILHISDDKPDESEANKLRFTTTGNIHCREIFMDFLNNVASFMN